MEFLADLHPIVVHFPVALLVTYSLLEIIGIVFNKKLFSQSAYILLIIGIIGIFISVLTGNQAFEDYQHWNEASSNIFNSHQFYANITTWFFVFLALLRTFLVAKKKFHGIIKYLFILLLILAIFTNFALILLYSFILNSFIVVLFSFVYILKHMGAQNMLPAYSFVLLSILFGAYIGLIIYLLLRYQGVKQQIPEFKRRDMFELTLPVKKILKYKLAICRDYAKLTAALLYNCSDSSVYFFTIPAHVATAVKIKDKYYIFDKKLPVLTKDAWLNKWNKTEVNVYSSEIVLNSEYLAVGTKFKNCEKLSISDFSIKDGNAINTAELTELTDNVSKLLGINQSSQTDISDFDFTLENYAVYYENDDIVKYSLTRAIKNKLENEFCGNIDKISKIEINQCENCKDLNLSVYL